MSAMGGRPGAARPDIVVSGRDRVPQRWPWAVVSERRRGRVRPLRRWPRVAAAAVLVAAGVVVVVVRPLVAAAEFRALESRWAAASALDAERGHVIARLAREGVPSDLATVTAAVLALQRQDAGRLALLRAGIGAGLAHDSAVSALAAAERVALSREITDLGGGVALTGWSVATYQATDRVQALLAAAGRRFGAGAAGSPRPARLTAADTTLARLRRPLDARVPAELVVASGSQLQIIDLRSGRILAGRAALQRLPAGLAPGVPYVTPAVVARAGFLAVQLLNGAIYAVPASLAGPPRRLGRGGPLLPAARADAVWIWSSFPGHLVLVNGAGRRIAGPVPGLPGSAVYPVGLAVPGGLVVAPPGDQTALQSHTGLWLWNPLSGRGPRAIVAGCAQPLAAHGTLLAWIRCSPDNPSRISLRITDTATGSTRIIADPANAIPFLAEQPTAAFSPDGRWLAAYYSGTAFSGFALGLVNVKTGATSIIRGAAVADATSGTPILWTGDSTRIFFGTGAAASGAAASGAAASQPWADAMVPFAAYHIGDHSAVDLRFHDAAATLVAVLPGTAG